VFVYKQKDGAMQDFIEGPFDDTIKTANFPVLSSIVGLALMQLERKILQINELVEGYIKPRLQNDFGVLVSAVDIAAVEADKESEGWRQLKSVTQDITAQTTQAQAAVNIQNMQDTQRINAGNMEETLRIQRIVDFWALLEPAR
jgi:hypothetical protein